MHLYLIRHGQSHVNLKDWNGGNQDAGLTALGKQQAEALACWLPRKLPNPDALYCSTMLRARETALPLAEAYGLEIIFEDCIREVGNNKLNHIPFPNDDLPEYGDFWSTERPFALINPDRNTEAFIHFRARVGIFIEEITHIHRDQHVIAVCHGGVIDAAFDHIFDTGVWRRCEVWSHNTAVTHFEHIQIPNREVWRLHFQNRIDHLDDLIRIRGIDGETFG